MVPPTLLLATVLSLNRVFATRPVLLRAACAINWAERR